MTNAFTCRDCDGTCARALPGAGLAAGACARLPNDAPKHTPWGVPSHVEFMTHGVRFLSTSSHGGYYLTPMALERVPACIKLATFNLLGVSGWFEEDHDADYVQALFPEVFGEATAQAAVGRLSRAYNCLAPNMQEDKAVYAFLALRYLAQKWDLAIPAGYTPAPAPRGWDSIEA